VADQFASQLVQQWLQRAVHDPAVDPRGDGLKHVVVEGEQVVV
jgi:hypothetical protein